MTNIEALKGLNLVDFLGEHYGLAFRRTAQGYVCRSPFSEDRDPSFFVRLVGGRWLFKDFSSGLGGSIIDLVQRLENLPDIGSVLRRIGQLLGQETALPAGPKDQGRTAIVEYDRDRGYDIGVLYQRFLGEDPDACRRYLLGRGIASELVEELILTGEVVHNRYQGKSYCCFAVRDGAGELRCLDNHEIGGQGKFVLGAKSVYSRDWDVLSEAGEVFVSEGVIDYLSIKTLEGADFIGIALLGNRLFFEAPLFLNCRRIISALDGDQGGAIAFVDLMEIYPDKELVQYPLHGHKDPNELLQAGGNRKRTQLTAEKKLELYRVFQRSDNKSALAREWGIDRSYMYEIVRELEQVLLSCLEDRQPGRPFSGRPETIKDACQQIVQLREENKGLRLDQDKATCREEFLRLRLKWAEIEAAELRGEPFDEQSGPRRKSQIKKKEKTETVVLIGGLECRFPHLPLRDICAASSYSRSQIYKWLQEVQDRKRREPEHYREEVIENAVVVIGDFPHFGGKKGQAFMLYHGLGLIGQKAYDTLKKQVNRILRQEVSGRKDLPVVQGTYEHVRPERIGQIWAEDFTEIVLDGTALKLALLIDVFSQYILGWALSQRATEALVARPVYQALAANDGKGPEKFMLRDNGKQYASDGHGALLAAHEVIERNIPAFSPQYNGAIECGGKEFKNIFYNVWERRERKGTDKEKNILERAKSAAAETVHLLNKEIPRPALRGVTPADVQQGRAEIRKAEIERYRQEELARTECPPPTRPFWETLKKGVKADLMSTKELLIKLAFFGMRPLRRIAQLNRVGVG